MKKFTLETTVGIFVIIGILCTAYLTVRLGKMELIGSNFYTIQARFSSVAGLTNNARIEIAGVQVGSVSRISLDPERLVAILDLKIHKNIPVSEDTIASIKTSGLIGEKYIQLSPGGSDILLKEGDMLFETESPLDIEDMISRYVFGGIK
ncbi:phospholipid/cholesterol/gamma-HCH transport system substrate-binding protein [Desulfobotulus alkaliphilus]|uniref:Phospholipid/cholesterol/gamma-HCH transport system substrate-binding protein n=1 Tax=Desulfobotulus alkaliphilus TaxID=622671 RepID=A0A562RD07_9BACT|nr:outer membrane lipid asymmetry maintenance protein MlaD [Desulfobotulus alkaliphilus]TWI66937.1 phospholipid/cholesterol/gamma-HCH transport system substrate-binding protein [Desulfobotulus alkaliphilus]